MFVSTSFRSNKMSPISPNRILLPHQLFRYAYVCVECVRVLLHNIHTYIFIYCGILIHENIKLFKHVILFLLLSRHFQFVFILLYCYSFLFNFFLYALYTWRSSATQTYTIVTISIFISMYSSASIYTTEGKIIFFTYVKL